VIIDRYSAIARTQDIVFLAVDDTRRFPAQQREMFLAFLTTPCRARHRQRLTGFHLPAGSLSHCSFCSGVADAFQPLPCCRCRVINSFSVSGASGLCPTRPRYRAYRGCLRPSPVSALAEKGIPQDRHARAFCCFFSRFQLTRCIGPAVPRPSPRRKIQSVHGRRFPADVL